MQPPCSLTVVLEVFAVPHLTDLGALGKAFEVFGEGLTPLLRELTGALVA